MGPQKCPGKDILVIPQERHSDYNNLNFSGEEQTCIARKLWDICFTGVFKHGSVLVSEDCVEGLWWDECAYCPGEKQLETHQNWLGFNWLDQWSSYRVILLPRRHWAMSRDTISCHKWGGGCYWYLVDKARDIARFPAIHRKTA